MINDFEDYYELLELSPNANLETIERVFRYFATKWHPDAGGDKAKFSLLVRAFETLRDPASRAAYDAKYQQQHELHCDLFEHAAETRPDSVDRHKLLAIFYARRRQNAKKPALGIHTVERLMKCPGEVLEFHLWYFREKGWIEREDSGGLSITSKGVDRIESTEVLAAKNLLIESQGKTATSGRQRELAAAGSSA